ncbi:PQQ-dependent sugar dehydrogenase [Maritimibacter dapengensis]|uniref:PQQ-dependent sugar dehydrogenase n=1 Tax=Maritimibacter dapengensis TaxID=2836868 RepID=A0ABS6T0M2_9RHOB|nr:PQQ-dependent sugar dehydrogenase [Maritimibacter dapengensis]MBV7378101.1 PQQ-dependent sugar dehydrogenase [Maritimibacter dapengensis]
MTKITHSAALAVTLAASPLALMAQDFNDAPPNAPDQTPAFEGQTRAPVLTDDLALDREVVADGLENPWGMDQLPDGGWIVTERPGRMRIVSADGSASPPISGLPEVDARRQGGLLDVTVNDDFAETRRVWWSFSEPRGGGENGTSVATGVLSEDGREMTEVEVIFQQQPAWASTLHYGSRLVFDDAGALFVTTGERSNPEPRQLAQDISTHLGKVIRIDPMGGAAEGNPEIEGGQPEIWSYGHRNLQAAALGPDGDLWTVEHGPRGGDELNRPEAGKNYGWPVITYGIDYSGAPIGEGMTAQEGMEQPIYYWDPVIAPSGMVFYDGDVFSDWQGDALIGGLASQSLVRLEIEDGRVTGEARYLQGQGRVRDVDVAQDGAVMVLTDSGNGALYRLTPAE